MFEKLKLTMAQRMRSFLRIYPSNGVNIQINELMDFDTNVAVNRIWYRGDSYELGQLYGQLDDYKFSFWGAAQSPGLEIRKIHTGLPKTMVNILAGLISDDLQNVNFDSEADNSMWQEISKENNFVELVKSAISKALFTGDGAFKISIDTTVSPYPILEFYEADRISIKRKRGRVDEITFKTVYINDDGQSYILHEHYGRGYIRYQLKDLMGQEFPLNHIDKTAMLSDIKWDGNFMMAEYMAFYSSDKFEGRGQSVFDQKRDNFDALDEAWSQWMDALRQGRSKTYIPESLLPRDAKTGAILRGNTFDNRFIKIASSLGENNADKIDVEQTAIPHDSYLNTYITALDLCLQGIISPSTLGIDTKKLDNAEAQREKEKATLYTRQTIVTTLQRVLPALITDVFYVYQTAMQIPLEEVGADVPFGEYANPSFESQVETVGKAKVQGIMSVEASVDELYGDTKSDEWKREEVARIRKEAGIVDMEEPAVNVDLNGGINGPGEPSETLPA